MRLAWPCLICPGLDPTMALLLLFLDQGISSVDILLNEGIIEVRDVLQLQVMVHSHSGSETILEVSREESREYG